MTNLTFKIKKDLNDFNHDYNAQVGFGVPYYRLVVMKDTTVISVLESKSKKTLKDFLKSEYPTAKAA